MMHNKPKHRPTIATILGTNRSSKILKQRETSPRINYYVSTLLRFYYIFLSMFSKNVKVQELL